MDKGCPCYLCNFLNRQPRGLVACSHDPENVRYVRSDYYFELLEQCPLGYMYAVQADDSLAFTKIRR